MPAKPFLLILAGFTCGLSVANAQLISVLSTNNGNGLFSYTFTLGNPSYAWGFSTNESELTMRFHGIQTAFSPAGWISEVETDDFVTWRYVNTDLVLLGNPSITFAIQSSSIGTALYDNILGSPVPDYPRGIVVGSVYDVTTLTGFAVGYETFSYIGPTLVPEPSAVALFGVAFCFVGSRLSRKIRIQ